MLCARACVFVCGVPHFSPLVVIARVCLLSRNLSSTSTSSCPLPHNLQYLYLNNNLLVSLPSEIGRCRSLSRLDLYNNPLDKRVRCGCM